MRKRDENHVTFPLRMTKELYRRIDALARAEHRTKANQMRHVLAEATKNVEAKAA